MTNHPIELVGPEVFTHDNSSSTHCTKMDGRSHNLGDTKPTSTGRTFRSIAMTKDAPLPPLPTELISISATDTAPPSNDIYSCNVAKPILRDQLPKKQDQSEDGVE
ncbi:hypothetical protein BGX24_004477 [Mortierella sp. AD032]|nr:hypothetical protein BGX24_004477 [Mortierella sp. AD032]